MNKYQEALNYLKGGNMFGELSNEALEAIEVLVGKETPIKPINANSFPLCPRCHQETVESTDYSMKKYERCINGECGQAIDWSDEE